MATSPIFAKLNFSRTEWTAICLCPSIYSQSDWSNSALYTSVMLCVFNHVSTAGKAAVQQSASVSLCVAHVVRKMNRSLTELSPCLRGSAKLLWTVTPGQDCFGFITVTQNEYDNNIRNQQGYLGNGDMTLCCSSSLAGLQPHMSLNNPPYSRQFKMHSYIPKFKYFS